MELAYNLYLTDIVHAVSQVLLVPVIVVLIAFIAYALWCVGSLVVEALGERRGFTAAMPRVLSALASAPAGDVPAVIAGAGLLNRQKAALLVLWDYRSLPSETHVALAKRLLADEDLRYKRIVARTDVITRLAPMFGLMGTLIPLGPGIVALGQGETATLSASIGVAFDTTVAGLITAAVTFAVSKVRSGWYEDYMVSLESAMTAILEAVSEMRASGTLDAVEPGTSLFDLGFERFSSLRAAVEEVIAQQRVAGGLPDDGASGDGEQVALTAGGDS